LNHEKPYSFKLSYFAFCCETHRHLAVPSKTEEGLQTIEVLVGEYKYDNYVLRLNSSVCDRLEDHDQDLYYKLLKEEVMAIYSYTTNDIYKKLNQTLNRGRKADKEKYGAMVDIINNGLAKLPKFKGSVIRFERKGSVNSWQPGKIKTFKAFTSSSKKKGFCWSGNTKMKIKSKTGRYIGMMSAFPNEEEVLFPPNKKFKVIKLKRAEKDTKPKLPRRKDP
jgi:hypothetical protein